MQKITYDAQYFNPKDVLECGQIFRYKKWHDGYLVFSKDLACYLYSDGKTTTIECEDSDYFYNFFDLGTDYAATIAKLKEFKVPILSLACDKCKGLRLLRQDPEEMIFSFIISQNNNIPRIKGIIERICESSGEKREFLGEEYYTFPTAERLAERPPEFYRALGVGYRDVFITETATRIKTQKIDYLRDMSGAILKKELLSYKGVGPKVADCICLFGFSEATSFPVDTWIEKIYHEDFGGTLTDRNKINAYFVSLFKELAGLAQQYLFYYKRGYRVQQ